MRNYIIFKKTLNTDTHIQAQKLTVLEFSRLYSLLCLEVALQIQLRDLGSAVSSHQQGRTTLQPSDTFHGSKYTKNVFVAEPQPQTHFWCTGRAYLEPRERVWWLQMSYYFC